jgi:hypothetical protein
VSESDDDLLKEIRDRYDAAESAWSDIRDEGDTDMAYVASDPWDEKDRKAREAAGRPCLSFDEAGQYLNQVINTIRANPRAMKFAPAGNDATDAGAEFYANKARETEYRSHAQLAYTTAFQNCVERSYGWCRWTTKEETDTSFNQELWLEDIPNPNMVLPDPHFKRPDGSDLRYLFFKETFPVEEFKRRWPKAKVRDFTKEAIELARAWFPKTDQITVAEYWVKEEAGSTRLLLYDGQEVMEDDVKDLNEKKIERQRKVSRYKVTQYITNGVEILETNEWKGQYIPFACCLGKVIYVEGKRIILSMMRLARDPIMAHAYMETCEAEIVGAVPRNSWIGYTGQFANPTEWQRAAHEPVAYLEANPTTEITGQQQILPLPQRQSWDPPIQNIEIAIEGKRRSIQAAIMGSPLPTQAQRHNEKSGVALQQIEKSGQIGSFHFSDHYDDMIRHLGVMYEDLCDKIYDAARNTGVRDALGNSSIVRINDPQPTQQQYPDPMQLQQAVEAWKARQPQGADPNMSGVSTKGKYLVTVSSGPAADSQREAVSEFVVNLMSLPVVQQMAPDLVVKAQASTMGVGQLNPILEELADRITPPQFKKPKPGEAPDPKQLMQQVQEAGQQIQQLNGMIQKLTQEITTKQIEQQGQLEKAQVDAQAKLAQSHVDADKEMAVQMMKLASEERQAAMDRETKLAVAELSAKTERTRLFLEERARLGAQMEDATQAHLDRAHEVGMTALEHATALASGEADHAHTLEQGDQQHGHALAQGEQDLNNTLASGALTPPKAGAAKKKSEPTPEAKPTKMRRVFERDPNNGLVTAFTDAPVTD